MCLYPKFLTNPKYKPNKKNGGKPPFPYDNRVLLVPIGCNQCIECRNQKAREWQVRLMEDIKEHTNGKFVTLTFSTESLIEIRNHIDSKIKPPHKAPEGYELDNAIATTAVRLFLERWRKEKKKSVRHWLITELGQNSWEHVHIHGIIWTDDKDDIKKHWKYGYVYPTDHNDGWKNNYVNDETVNYIVKYVNKVDELHKTYKPIILTSAGIGSRYIGEIKYPYCKQEIHFNEKTRKWSVRVKIKYITEREPKTNAITNKFKDKDTNETYRTESGHKVGLPKYYRNKIYTDEEKEKLWINLLDKEKRYVCKEEVDISKGEEIYFKTVEYYRKINKELGYGDDKTWKRANYETERRIIIQNKRLNT